MNLLRRTWAEINLSALVHNFEIIKNEAKNTHIMAVVKADAYGHSAKDIAPTLQNAGADSFAVSNIDEALQLRSYGITKPILILGYTPVSMVSTLTENDISQCVYSLEYANALSAEAVKLSINIKVHIKLDTGMSRLGFNCRNEELAEIDDAIFAAKLDGFITEGLFTHFSVSDRSLKEDDGFTEHQFRLFCSAKERFTSAGISIPLCHCCNSAALILDKEKLLDVCRPGIVLYGLHPSYTDELKRDFIPVMTLKSVVSMVKTIKSGNTISYGRTFKAEKDIRIATVSAGYGDGYPRALSNKSYVIIRGKKAPVLGRICMDQLSVDVSDIPDVSMGDEVILFGKEISVDELATLSDTINYEIVCGINQRVPRIIIK